MLNNSSLIFPSLVTLNQECNSSTFIFFYHLYITGNHSVFSFSKTTLAFHTYNHGNKICLAIHSHLGLTIEMLHLLTVSPHIPPYWIPAGLGPAFHPTGSLQIFNLLPTPARFHLLPIPPPITDWSFNFYCRFPSSSPLHLCRL